MGGTGVTPRDVTPESTRDILDRELLGIAEALRASALSAGIVDAGVSRGHRLRHPDAGDVVESAEGVARDLD